VDKGKAYTDSILEELWKGGVQRSKAMDFRFFDAKVHFCGVTTVVFNFIEL
jgi:hypothetical protein